ncbi:MAG: hypothetical protein IPM39_27880 [Chloroflexi bacterium]|nr:hypothetical protein [Chloroflexota bacterium]
MGEVSEITQSIALSEFAPAFTQATPRFQLSAIVAEYAEILRCSYWAKDNSLGNIVTEARRIAEYLPGDADVQEFANLVMQAANLSAE